MNRRVFLKAIGSTALLPILPRRSWASTNFRRHRPADAAWPSQSAWQQLNDAVGGNLLPVNFPVDLVPLYFPHRIGAQLFAEQIEPVLRAA